MRRYETIFITDPDLQENERDALTKRLDELISQQNGTLLQVDDWGQKRLAYEIKKRQRGHYIRLDYCGTGPLVDEMERLFRIDDKILKYMTVLLEKSVDIEAAKEEIAREEAEKERALKERAESIQETSSTATESAETAPGKVEQTSSDDESTAGPDAADADESAPETEETKVSSKKE